MPLLRLLLTLTFVLAAALVGYGVYIEPNSVRVEEVVIKEGRLAAAWGDITIAHLTDLHIDRSGTREKKLVGLLARMQPDMIVITGDFVQWNSDPQPAIDFTTSLHAPLGVYCVLGDSDIAGGRRHCLFCHPDGDVHRLRDHPRFLKNETVDIPLDKHGHAISVAGYYPQNGLSALGKMEALRKEEQTPLLMLSHFSAGWEEVAATRPLLWLCGDTHGGQVRLPDSLWRSLKMADCPDYRAGLFGNGSGKWLYVNRGIGVSDFFPLRIGVPPEVTLIRFSE